MSLKFGQMRPLVSMATDRVIMGENVSTLAPSFLIGSSYLQVTRTSITFGNSGFSIGKSENSDFFRSYCSQ